MADLIDRHWLMERLGLMDDCCECQYHHGPLCSMGSEFVIACEAISDAPPVQSEPRWIPVGERLPGASGNYLVTVKSIGWNCEESVVIDIAYWDSSEGFHKATEVVAWMPLPEAYKGETDD